MKEWLLKFARSAAAEDGKPARIGARQLYIFPTGAGLVYGLMLFAMLMGSLNYDSNLGLLFTFLFAATALVALLHTWRNLLHLELSAADAPPLFAGGEAEFPLHLRGDPGREHPGLRLQAGGGSGGSVQVAADTDTQFRLLVPAGRRGRLSLGRVRVETRFPLGLFRAWAYAELPGSAVIYPRPGTPQPLGLLSTYTRSEKGDRGQGADDFVGPRPYRAGDPPRHLDWKALARERGLVTRQFGGDRAEQLWLDWDLLPDGDTEERLSRLCRMVLDADAQGLAFGLRLPGQSLPPAAGESHKHRCLGLLALYGTGDPSNAVQA